MCNLLVATCEIRYISKPGFKFNSTVKAFRLREVERDKKGEMSIDFNSIRATWRIPHVSSAAIPGATDM